LLSRFHMEAEMPPRINVMMAEISVGHQ